MKTNDSSACEELEERRFCEELQAGGLLMRQLGDPYPAVRVWRGAQSASLVR